MKDYQCAFTMLIFLSDLFSSTLFYACHRIIQLLLLIPWLSSPQLTTSCYLLLHTFILAVKNLNMIFCKLEKNQKFIQLKKILLNPEKIIIDCKKFFFEKRHHIKINIIYTSNQQSFRHNDTYKNYKTIQHIDNHTVVIVQIPCSEAPSLHRSLSI